MSRPDPPSGMGQVLRQAIGRTHERRKLDAACREAVRGKSRDEAREIVIEEYRRIGEEPPGQPILDRRVDMLLAPPNPVSRATDAVEAVSVLVGVASRFKELLDTAADSEKLARHRSDLFLKPDWHRTGRVELVDDAQSWVGDVPLTGLISYRDLSLIKVRIQASASRDEGGVLMVKVGERTVGTAEEVGSDPLWEVLEVKIGGEFLIGSTAALRTQDSDGLWRLDLGAPEEVRHWPRFDDWPGEDDESEADS